MSTSIIGKPVLRQVSFFPSEGKWHAAHRVHGSAFCGRGWPDVTLPPIVVAVGDTRVHPIVCRHCLQAATSTTAPLGLRS